MNSHGKSQIDPFAIAIEDETEFRMCIETDRMLWECREGDKIEEEWEERTAASVALWEQNHDGLSESEIDSFAIAIEDETEFRMCVETDRMLWECREGDKIEEEWEERTAASVALWEQNHSPSEQCTFREDTTNTWETSTFERNLEHLHKLGRILQRRTASCKKSKRRLQRHQIGLAIEKLNEIKAQNVSLITATTLAKEYAVTHTERGAECLKLKELKRHAAESAYENFFGRFMFSDELAMVQARLN